MNTILTTCIDFLSIRATEHIAVLYMSMNCQYRQKKVQFAISKFKTLKILKLTFDICLVYL